MTYTVQAMAAARRNLIQRIDSFVRATVRGERRPTGMLRRPGQQRRLVAGIRIPC